jgi:large subunit ribosomal protein L24
MKRIKKDDTVMIIAGNDKNLVGKVRRVLDNKVVVEGARLIKKHVKPNPKLQQEGGIISLEAPIDLSNVAIFNPISKKADKVGFKYLEENGKKRKVRYFKSNNEVIDLV